MKILSASQTREADQYTIEHEPTSSYQLMERAAQALARRFQKDFPSSQTTSIFCGMGNNGGDGLALGRLLYAQGYQVKLFVIAHSNSGSADFRENKARAHAIGIPVFSVREGENYPALAQDDLVVDAILGSGLNRPLEGFLEQVVMHLNELPNPKLAIDIPTGLFADDNRENDLDRVFRADLTYSLQHPKLSLLDFNTLKLAGLTKVLDIGLHPDFLEKAESSNFYLEEEDFRDLHQQRQKHSYKGTYGHALLVAGSRNSMGAAIMSARAALRSGAGLLTAHIPSSGLGALNTALPEAMLQADKDQNHFSEFKKLDAANATAVGPGLGTETVTAEALGELIRQTEHPMVLDADALNLLSTNPAWYEQLPENSILTPHPGELKRLLELDELGFDYLDLLRDFCRKHKLIVVLKYSITVIINPRGEAYFMDEGTPALASPGSGDVLTGIILGLLASGYPPENAAMLAVYLQGKSARQACGDAPEACLASDIIEALPQSWRQLQP